MDPLLTLAAGHHVEVARLARLEEIDRLGRHGGRNRTTARDRPRLAAFWAVATTPR